jgi:DNA-binding NarL/FixJ family response regulator
MPALATTVLHTPIHTPAPPLVPVGRPPATPMELGNALLSQGAHRRGIRPSGELVRVALLDDQHLMRLGLRALLAQDPRLQLVGDGARLEEVERLVVHGGAQVVLLNADMEGGVAALQRLSQLAAAPRVVALGDDEHPDRMLALFRAGAFGYLPKSVQLPELRDAIEAVAAGGTYVRASTARAMASGLRAPGSAGHGRANGHANGQANGHANGHANGSRQLLDRLSGREQTVFTLIARGYSGPEIAAQLGITAKTVDTYRHRIHEKIGVQHRSAYVQAALDAGLLATG